MTESTDLTTAQRQRKEALKASAALLVDRSISSTSSFSKGNDSAMKVGAMFAADAPEAITLAEYIVTGIEAPMSDEERLVRALHVGFDDAETSDPGSKDTFWEDNARAAAKQRDEWNTIAHEAVARAERAEEELAKEKNR